MKIKAASEMQSVPHKAKTKGNVEKAYVSATFYIPRPTHKKLKEHCTEHDTSIQQILEEAMDMWMATKATGAAFFPDGWQNIGKKEKLK